jgi:hypothetical protein
VTAGAANEATPKPIRPIAYSVNGFTTTRSNYERGRG